MRRRAPRLKRRLASDWVKWCAFCGGVARAAVEARRLEAGEAVVEAHRGQLVALRERFLSRALRQWRRRHAVGGWLRWRLAARADAYEEALDAQRRGEDRAACTARRRLLEAGGRAVVGLLLHRLRAGKVLAWATYVQFIAPILNAYISSSSWVLLLADPH